MANVHTPERQRKSERLGLSFVYDWSNPDIGDEALILNVLERGFFKDICRVCAHYGLERVKQSCVDLPDEVAGSAWLNRMLKNIEIGFGDAQIR
ncbi:hypothetical protein AGMMS50225_24360 [Betaproteobacteria bacterium]|nr:hypothetical protein AGMMS50225_24360 [Betaproteobacteria bacterium]